ncbi:MAG: hypothetical protein KKC19_03520 [Nanoarchaeota archaeon]|nr:hypothetical protein [Nanoarchaeota archaeon]
MEQYNLRSQDGGVESLLEDLQGSPSRMYDLESVRYNFDNCECPECPCCDPDMKFLWPIGVGVLAATTPILVATTAAGK